METDYTNCEKCGLHKICKSPFMEPYGAENPKVLVIGEAPGYEEDEQGIPFVGRSGKKLRTALQEFFDVESEVCFTNVVHCRPPDNKISKRAVNCCKHNVVREIEELDPELVLLLGNMPLNVVLGENGISTWNGVVVERDGRVYVPLFHPAYILRNESAQDEWLEGMFAAEETLVRGNVRSDSGYEYIYPLTVADVKAMQKYLADHEWISYDTEVTTLDAHSENTCIIAISFATDERAYAMPVGHPEAPWSDNELDDISNVIIDILKAHDGSIVGHNLKFDQQQTLSHFGVWFAAGGDTMLISHLLSSRSGIHGLKRLAGIHLGMYDYDKDVKDYAALHVEADPYRGGSYAHVPLEILLPYAAMDASATYMLDEILYEELSDKQKVLYEEMILAASDSIARMEYAGIVIDDWVAERYYKAYSIVQRDSYELLLEDKAVQQLVETKQREEKGKKKFAFNPNSHVQLRELYYKYAGIPEPEERTSTGLPTTKYDVVRVYAEKYPIVSKVREWSLLGDMLSKYIGPAVNGKWKSGDGRVHGYFNLHGTETGRLSSSNPNLQNIPTPEKEPGTLLAYLPIKNLFTHSYWDGDVSHGYVMSADYSGMELRVFASLANCGAMLDIHRSGEDFHTMVASMVSGIPYDKITKSQRYVYKWTNWTMLYKGGALTLHRMYGIPMREAERIVGLYHRQFPEVRDYQEYLVEFAKENGYVESPFGRRTHYPYINDRDPKRAAKDRRSAINMPIQSAASDITLIALVLIDWALRDGELATCIVNTVHDSIVLDVPEQEVDKVANICKSTMEGVKDLVGFYMPGIDMSWLKCPLKADIEIGTHYGALSEYVRNAII